MLLYCIDTVESRAIQELRSHVDSNLRMRVGRLLLLCVRLRRPLRSKCTRWRIFRNRMAFVHVKCFGWLCHDPVPTFLWHAKTGWFLPQEPLPCLTTRLLRFFAGPSSWPGERTVGCRGGRSPQEVGDGPVQELGHSVHPDVR